MRIVYDEDYDYYENLMCKVYKIFEMSSDLNTQIHSGDGNGSNG